ncbi:MAG TPA: hypothetical protein VHK01_09670 [Lacipirellulaceae bacterium]|jgi:uncharacterized membrane protein|nr:hypothetical protein [Lacipirellulaceae bacterium]
MQRKDCTSDLKYASDGPRFSLRFVFIAVAVLSPVVWFFAFLRNQEIERRARIEERTQSILATLEATVKEVEAIRAKLGRAPTDERELEQLMGHPMPTMPVYRLYYRQTASNSFYLLFPIEWVEPFSGDYLIYHSNKPNVGWVVGYN